MTLGATTRTCAFAVGVATAAGSALALDPWEGSPGDDDATTVANTLTHGAVQEHDLDRMGGPVDQDCFVVPTTAGRSYEARLQGANLYFDTGFCGACAQMDRIDRDGAVLQPDANVMSGGGVGTHDRTIRWIATANHGFDEFIRVRGNANDQTDASSVYTMRFWDTTYAIPRWNAANGQLTVFLIQNLVDTTVSGTVRLHAAGGAVVHEQPFTLPPNQLMAWNTATVPALAGQSGHAYVVHTAGYGGLAGKAVALEAATGFSFDTPMQPIPH